MLLAVRKTILSNIFHLNKSFTLLSQTVDLIEVKIMICPFPIYLFNIYVLSNSNIEIYNSFVCFFESLNFMYCGKIVISGNFNIRNYAEIDDGGVAGLISSFASYFDLHQFNNIINVNNRIFDLTFSNLHCNSRH